ncbi:MAG: choice-of-anchor I family protein [Burkholderiales bacterium]
MNAPKAKPGNSTIQAGHSKTTAKKQLLQPNADAAINLNTSEEEALQRRAKLNKKSTLPSAEQLALSNEQPVSSDNPNAISSEGDGQPRDTQHVDTPLLEQTLDGASENILVADTSGTAWMPDELHRETIAQAGNESAASGIPATGGTPASAGGGSATEAGASGAGAGTSGALGMPALALAGVGIAAAAGGGGGGGGSSAAVGTTTAAAAAATPIKGSVIDGYLKGATVFIDKDGDGVLDPDEPSTITANDGSYSLPGGVAGKIVAFGGTDIGTGLAFKGVLKAPSGSTVVTPLTTMVADLISANVSAAQAEEKVLKALGLGSLDSKVDLLNFDPIAAASGGNTELAALGLQIHKAGVTVASMVVNMTEKIRAAAGADDSMVDNIAGDVFAKLAAQLADNSLDTNNIGAFAGNLVDTLADSGSLGGVSIGSFKSAILESKQALSESSAGLSKALENLSDLSQIGNTQKASVSAVQLLNASIDGVGDLVTLYFDSALDAKNLPTLAQFEVDNGGLKTLSSFQVVNNQVILKLAAPLNASHPVKISFQDNAAADGSATIQDLEGIDAQSFHDVVVENRLALTGSGTESFAHASSLSLAGAEISAFDAASKRLFVTSFSGLQVVGVDNQLAMSLIGKINLGSNDINSVAVKDGIVAVAVAATDKTQPGTVYFLDADGDVASPSMILGSVTVGALPDMLTFSADGKTLLAANEGEQDVAGNNPEGSVSIIDLSGGVAAASVKTASFAAFNDKLEALQAAGVRLFAGETGFANITVAQDLEPEYISIAPDGKTAFVTLQENNAIGILDLATGQFTDIVPLGKKSFLGLPFDGSDRDGAGNTTSINPQTDQPVFGQYMPDSIASFKGVDGQTYYVIANEGDDRDDFITPDETARVAALNLDDATFPNETALKTNTEIGRLTVSNAPGNNGDIDGDGDIDQILAYGARSFSILNEDGVIIFDSGSHIEQFVAAGGLFTNRDGAGLFDDTRSDNKGPEPEGIAIGQVGSKTLAFVGLERGGGGVMVYDVTDPEQVSFVQHLRKAGDESPEGLTFVDRTQSPNGADLLFVTNEVSNTVSVFHNTKFTLQLLHFTDGEAGLLASQTAPNLAALVDAFEDDYANSITLTSGDNFIPGPFLAAGTDSSVINEINTVSGSTLPANATVPIGAVDILMHNAIGVEASAIGNHEFDLGSQVFRDSFLATATYKGANFPYLSSNLDFSVDSVLNARYTDTTATAGLELASSLKGRIAPSAILIENGEKIGLVGATTQILEAISSASGTEVKGFPTGAGANGEVDDMTLLAAQLQPVINDLIAQGVNKIILMTHLQVIANEKLLATKLSGVDIILSGGSNTRLGDANDDAVAFPGHSAQFADTYPLVIRDKDGNNTLIVNTDNEYTYLGRLVVDFDVNGRIIVDSIQANSEINGAYAATAENVAQAWGITAADLDTTAFANGTRGANVKLLTDAVQDVIDVKDSNVYGYSNVYLEGERNQVRAEETNLGNLSADANLYAARLALGASAAATPYIVSLKNGGGIRAQIGTISAPDPLDGTVDKLPPDGGVSQLDVENSLRFNNQLMMFDTTAEGLKAILEHGVAAGTLQGRFPQIGGVAFSWDPDFAVGARVSDIALVGEGYRVNLYNNGVKLASAPSSISVVTLSFTANGGDSYPIKANAQNFRYLMEQGDGSYTLSGAVDEALDFTATSVVLAHSGGSAVEANDALPGQSPAYLLGTQGRAAFQEVITVGEKAANGYVFDGIPDGIGVIENGNGTLRVLVNHELGGTAGVVRAHGSKGAYVSELIIDKATLSVISGQDVLQSANNLYLASADGTSWSSGATTAFNRFCSGDLADMGAFKSATAGYDGRIYLTGEESGAEGRAFAHVLTGAEAGKVYELPSLGNMAFENAVANAYSGGKTVVAAMDDSSTNGQVYFYVGNKSATGNAVEMAGLAGGKLFGVKVGAGSSAATEVGVLTAAGETGLGLTNGATQFSLVDLGDVKGKTGTQINTDSIAAGVTNFLRPEDGAWSLDGKTFYFVTTASTTTASRLWALEFGSAANPEAGGTIKMLLDGSEGQIMLDNMTVANDGSLILQEDPGANDRLAKIWKYTPGSDTLVELAQHDPVLFAGADKLTNDEESSGVVDVTAFFTGVAGYDTAKYNYFMVADQIHKAVTDPASAVEMGQLSIMATAKDNKILGEQAAFATYMEAFHATPQTAFNQADTLALLDTRIQNLNARGEDVLADIAAPTLAFAAPGNTYDLANYTQVGRYALPADPLAANKLAHEASGVTYNKDTDTLFVVGDAGTSITQVTKLGVLVDSMALAAGTSPQGTLYYDPEGITYISGGKFVFVEERDREFNEFTYVAGTTLGDSSGVRTVKLGTTIGNIGIEGLTLDPMTGGYIAVKEATPLGVFQTTVDFAAGTASNGSPTAVNSTDLFDPAKTGLATHSDVFALSNILTNTAGDYGQMLILGAVDGKVVKIDRAGNIQSSLLVGSAAKNEGITMDGAGNIYVVGEEGGGSTDKPELLVYSPTVDKNAVGLGSNLYLTFGHAVSAGTGNFVLSNGAGDTRNIAVGDSSQVSFKGNSVTINPTADLIIGRTYTLTYDAGVLKDAAGGNVPALSGNTMSFATIADTQAPTLVSSSPLDNATGVTSNHIVLTFNEAVAAGTGNIVINGVNASNVTDTRTIAVGDITQVTISGTTVDINPGADLLNGYAYNVQFASGVIKDAAGNAFAGIANATTLNFAKGAATTAATTLLISEVNSNASPNDFFELYNYGSTTVDLSGWKWDDDSASFTDAASATFASGTSIAAGQRLVVVGGATDPATFKTAWGLGGDVATVAVGGPGLGSGDAIVLFNASGSVVTSFNYSGVNKTASDASVVLPAAAATGVTFVVGHAGAAYGGTATTSAVWDGVSTSTPAYKAAAVGVEGGFAQPAVATNIGSPGLVAASNQADTTAPTLTVSSPVDNATGAAVGNNLTLTFNEAVKVGSGNILITNTANAADTRTIAVTDTSQVSVNGGIVTINPAANLLANSNYSVTLASGVIQDIAGNNFAGIVSSTALDFTTAGPVKPNVLITEVNSNAGPADFFELYNYGSTTVDLSGWKWDDDSASFTDAASATFASGTTIAAGQRLVVVASTTDATFKTNWGLASDVPTVAFGGPGLGGAPGDAVVLFNAAGAVVTSFNYSSTNKTATDGTTIAPSVTTSGASLVAGHAGVAFGGSATTSAVWDGVSTSAPTYKAAAVGVDGGFAQALLSTNIGSPGVVFGAINAPSLGFAAPGNTYDLANYTQTGRYALPADPLVANKLAHEASGVTYNKDTDTLFVVGDGGTSVAQVTKQGVLVNSMALAAGTSPQGTFFYDPEGIAYIGGGKFVFVEERDREFNEFTYTAGATLGGDSGVRTVKLGTTIGNIGIEGLTLDPMTGGYIAVKEATPLGVFQTTVDFAAGTASNGSATAVNSTDLFDPAKTGLSTHSDVFALSNILTNTAGDYGQMLILGAVEGKVVKIDRAGNVQSSLLVGSAAKNEGITMDGAGNIYVVGEEGGGSTDKPELLVYSPTVDKNAVGLGSNLYLNFNQPVTAGTGNFVLSNGAGDTRNIAAGDTTQVSFSGNSVTINPTADLTIGKNYTLTYDAGVLKDANGGNVAALSGNTLSFATIADTQAPTLVSTSPIDNATGVTSNHIVLTFNEAVAAGTGNIVLSGVNSNNVVDTRTIAVGDITQVTISGTTVDINPGADLLNGYAYNVQLASGVIKDAAGNAFAGISNATTLNFAKGAATTAAATLLISEVNSNASPNDFFELYNFGSTTVDLSGWKWDDDSASFTDAASATFASGTSIAAGQRLVVVGGATDPATFKTAWGLGTDVATVAVGGPGLGSGDTIVLFNASGSVVTSFNYSGVNKTASDASVILPSTASTGVSFVVGHAGAAYGGTATTSAVWDGVSTSTPAYKAAAVGIDGGFAQPAVAANIGSPGKIGAPLTIGDILFMGANGDAPDAFAFMLTKSTPAGTQIGFTDRNYSNANGFAGVTNESAMLWTADKHYAPGSIVTIQPDQAAGTNPVADKGAATGAPGGISTTAETIYAFKGSIANLLTGGAGEITLDQLLASINVGGAAAGDIPASLAGTSISLPEDNSRYTGPLNTGNMSTLATQIMSTSNWTGSDLTPWPVTIFITG